MKVAVSDAVGMDMMMETQVSISYKEAKGFKAVLAQV